MKVVIDLIENLRESIGNDGSYRLAAMLLKEDSADTKQMMFEIFVEIVGAKVTKELVGFGVNPDTKQYGLFIMA